MEKLARAVVMLVFTGILSACVVASKVPLLPAEEAQAVFGDTFLALNMETPGVYIDNTGAFNPITGEASDKVYQLSGLKGVATFMLHDAGDLPFDYIGSLMSDGATFYTTVKLTDDGMEVQPLVPDPALWNKLQERGVIADANASEKGLTTRFELEEALRAWSDLVAAKEIEPKLGMRFAIGRGKGRRDALLGEAQTQACLAFAGNTLEPMVRRLPGKFAFGIPMQRIQASPAMEACKWAVTGDAPTEARYGLARIFWRTQNYARSRPIADALISEDYALGYVLRAEDLMGDFGEKDLAAARALLEDAAPRHGAVAYVLATAHEFGRFGEADMETALKWYRAAAGADVGFAHYSLGRLSLTGNGVPEDKAAALAHFERGIAVMDINSHVEAARMHLFADGTERDYGTALRLLAAVRETGEPLALYYYGLMKGRGLGTDKAYPEANGYLQQAFDGGVLDAGAEIAWMTAKGLGVAADPAKARKTLEELKAKGSQLAATYLAALGN